MREGVPQSVRAAANGMPACVAATKGRWRMSGRWIAGTASAAAVRVCANGLRARMFVEQVDDLAARYGRHSQLVRHVPTGDLIIGSG